MIDFSDLSSADFAVKFAVIFSLALLAALIIGVILAHFLTKKKHPTAVTTRDIACGAAVIAISYGLSFIGIKLPYGGTITPASSLPIMIYCYFFGFKKSLPVCVAYTLLQTIQEPYIVHFFSAVLDYIIPYMALIFVAVFSFKSRPYKKTADQNGFAKASFEAEADEKNGKDNVMKNMFKTHYRFFIGILFYIVIRYISHVISGAVYWGSYAWDGWGIWPYSFAYNSFFLIDAFIAVIAGAFLLASKNFCRFMTVSGYALKNPDTAKEHD